MRWLFPFLRVIPTAALVVLLVVLLSSVDAADGLFVADHSTAFTTITTRSSSTPFSGWPWRSPSSSPRTSASLASTAAPSSGTERMGGRLVMDTERDDGGGIDRLRIDRTLFGGGISPSRRIPLVTTPDTGDSSPDLIEEAESVHGMPWGESVDGETPLLYMPFWEWQMGYMRRHLTNLRVVDCSGSSGSDDFAYNEATHKGTKHRVVNLCFESDEYRKIRMTYYDAGSSAQVFNSLWYPDARYDLPVLGVDLLSFNNAKKNLAVVDFQPLHEDVGQDGHALPYEHLLAPIRDEYPALQGKMSSRFYDEARFFSDQMLFGRFERDGVVDDGIILDQLEPAFRRYVAAHVDLVRRCDAADAAGLSNDRSSPESVARVLDRQAAYDAYSAERDPAHALFSRIFGKEWADGYVHDFLFDMSGSGKGGR